MEVMAGFIVGFDNDPDDIFERQIDFIRESAIPLAMVGLLTALPDTQLWRRLEREGRLLDESTRQQHRRLAELRPAHGRGAARRRLQADPAHHLQPRRVLPARARLPGARTCAGRPSRVAAGSPATW